MHDVSSFYPGPGGQPLERDGASLQYLSMPRSMHTYTMPRIRPPGSNTELRTVLTMLRKVAGWLEGDPPPPLPLSFDVTRWDDANRDLLNQVLGEGEVSIRVGNEIRIQESVLAGLWRILHTGADGTVADRVEVGPIPRVVRKHTFAGAADGPTLSTALDDPELMNAPSLLAEIEAHLRRPAHGVPAISHVINLTLLPLTEADLRCLTERLGPGRTAILSRGYGNCRMSSTATRRVWWVQYFNSQGELILNTLHLVDVPAVACAAPEDLRDSARRLREILEVYL